MTVDIGNNVMRNVAWRLIPFLSIGYLVNALDRFNVSIAALTMNKELGLSATTYGLAAGAFFWSYVLFQFPANAILTRLGARRWLGITMFVWGACSAGTAFVTGATSFVVMRFLLGIAESGFFPGVAWFMTCWFPSGYRGRAMGIFYAFGASANVVGAPISGSLLLLHGWHGLSGWQWLFLIEGITACRHSRRDRDHQFDRQHLRLRRAAVGWPAARCDGCLRGPHDRHEPRDGRGRDLHSRPPARRSTAGRGPRDLPPLRGRGACFGVPKELRHAAGGLL